MGKTRTMDMTAREHCALVTGAAGFIGYHLSLMLLDRGWRVVGFDALTPDYDLSLKAARRDRLIARDGFAFVEGRLETPGALADLFAAQTPDLVVHLAGHSGAGASINDPEPYAEANLMGTFRLLEAMRAHPPAHSLLASTCGVYGDTPNPPFAEGQTSDTPLSFYAATKKAAEAMAHSYAHLYGLPITMFRAFNAYGPWDRPDTAIAKFTQAILKGEPIDVYNHGNIRREFIYIDDLVTGLTELADAIPKIGWPVLQDDSLSKNAPYRIVNIANGHPTRLLEFIRAIETATGREAEMRMLPRRPGSTVDSRADSRLFDTLTGERATTALKDGVQEFVTWYREYNGLG